MVPFTSIWGSNFPVKYSCPRQTKETVLLEHTYMDDKYITSSVLLKACNKEKSLVPCKSDAEIKE